MDRLVLHFAVDLRSTCLILSYCQVLWIKIPASKARLATRIVLEVLLRIKRCSDRDTLRTGIPECQRARLQKRVDRLLLVAPEMWQVRLNGRLTMDRQHSGLRGL